MAVEVRLLEDGEEELWNRALAASPMAAPFHHLDALSVLDAHSDGTLYRIVGLNGQEPIGVFPVFAVSSPLVTVARSPPPVVNSLPLGPIVGNLDKMKARRAEQFYISFMERALDVIDEEIAPDGYHFRTDTRFEDTRPFRWAGLSPTPYHTYEVDLDRPIDDIWAGFSSDARKYVRDSDPDRYDISLGDSDDIAFIVEQVQNRYIETDSETTLTADFVTDLYEALPDGIVRPYVIHVDGERVSGLVTLWFGDRVYRWQGSVRTDVDLPTSDLIDWRVIGDAVDEEMAAYDLVGANIKRISRYKSKFGPTLRTYYNVYGGNNRLLVRNVLRSFAETASDRLR